ncbi:hypothetical protein JOD55_000381 [Arcanobacterium pluranimalium]|uniref:DUF5926 family protein n=1 Tax=Arcanobacterium pluranimalium TaxID=108028 RepID=UPI001959F3A3|nr:DUF5926 family protein [Arcanobacterium pluranimalium]MBM7824554.1 hypothetical protein [Arcanobacterium pluranimalium]
MGKKSRRIKENKPKRARVQFVDRPFEGLPFEAELVAMSEIIPAATLPVRTTEEHGAEEILLVTMLPQMVGAIRRSDGKLLVAAQTVMSSGDASTDIADRILWGLELENGETFNQTEQPEPGSRLQDILDLSFESKLQLEEDFGFWIGEDEASKPDVAEAISQTKEQIIPTVLVDGVDGAYWTRMQREFVRWVRKEDEDSILNALARLQTRRELTFDGARFVGAFRAQGLLIPVFELEPGTEASELSQPMAEFDKVLTAEIESSAALTPEERRAKAGIVSRQVTLR